MRNKKAGAGNGKRTRTHLMCWDFFVLRLFKGESKSNVNRNATGTPSPLAIDSNFSKDGAFFPRSIRLRKSTDIPTISANASWLFFRS
jgi:hypothetical protein